jgi:chitinase
VVDILPVNCHSERVILILLTPSDYYLADHDAALWLATVLIEGFGPKVAGSTMPRPFGDDVAVDGFDLDIESSTADGNQKFQYYGDFVKIVKQLAPNMLISSAPQCVVPDAHLDKAIAEAPFDYVFVQFYNTDACSAAQGLKELKDKKGTGFTWSAWSKKLLASANPKAKLFLGLPAGTNGANPNHYLSR